MVLSLPLCDLDPVVSRMTFSSYLPLVLSPFFPVYIFMNISIVLVLMCVDGCRGQRSMLGVFLTHTLPVSTPTLVCRVPTDGGFVSVSLSVRVWKR